MAELPDLPKGKEFEEYISACFQCAGYYVARNIIERQENEEILELDIVATAYEKAQLKNLIIEAKAGYWGFSDIFKIKGWLDYLGYSDGLLITNSKKENATFYEDKAKEIGIRLFQITDLSKEPAILKEIIPNCLLNKADYQMWRFSYWLERKLLSDLKRWKKKFSGTEKRCYKQLDEYYFLLNSGIFFTKSIPERVRKLYETFELFPRISARCGNEMIGKSFDEDVEQLPREIYSATYYDCEYNVVQVSAFIEHRARLALLKSATDYILEREKRGNKNFDKKNEKQLLSFLPQSFINGIKELSKHKYFYKYPVFWQWFMWLMGGFILLDYESQEYDILSDKSGIPVNEILNALRSYEILFPQEKGWFIDLTESNIKVLKVFPLPFSGVGANFRRVIYTRSQKFEDLNISGKHTLSDLIKWNNLSVEVLEDDA